MMLNDKISLILFLVVIIAILIAIWLCAKYMLYKPKTYAISLEDSPIHFDRISQQPIMPRQVREQYLATIVPAAVAETTPVPEAEEEVALQLNPDLEVSQVEHFQGESELLAATLEKQADKDEMYSEGKQNSLDIYVEIKDTAPSLTGERLIRLLDRYLLRFGEKNYFHRYNDQLNHMFSVAQVEFAQQGDQEDVLKPFNIHQLENERITSLLFFLNLPHHDALTAYDMMVSTIQRIAREIDARVYVVMNKHKQEFSLELAELLRQEMQKYSEKHHI
ncbi:MAG: cell division protein ZipA C-terminal FtsZ-binding domain-containing protein [Acinetobacter sp.]|nr:cell division protein ZipA C-terminal FtsZ-binding domain-containing protein [Acinetobacter sp.]